MLTEDPPPTLAAVLALDDVGGDVHRSRVRADSPRGRMFGGEVAGQAVLAAGRTVPADRPVHSLHGYFLLAGNPEEVVDHHVDRTRDGGSFTTRVVRAEQSDGTIFVMAASFQRPEDGIEHRPVRPDCPTPDDSLSLADVHDRADEESRGWLRQMQSEFPWDFRFPIDPSRGDRATDERRRTWFRLPGPLPDEAPTVAQSAALTHASDLFLLGAALQRHGLGFGTRGLFVTSLDHTIWFHEPFDVTDWLLYDQRSSWAGGGRTLCRGRFWNGDGRLVATVAQEGLVRTG